MLQNLNPSNSETHPAFKFFYKFNDLWSVCLQKTANGEICGQHLKTTSGSKTGLTRHLLNSHDIDCKNPKEMQTPITDYSKPPPLISKDFKNRICRFVVCDGYSPWRLAKSDLVREILFELHKKELPKSPNTIWKIIEEYVTETREKLMNLLQGQFNGSLTADEWTDLSGQRYMNVNVHIKDKQYCLGLARIDKSANAEFLAEVLNQRLEEFKVDAFFITTDGAAVMGSMCKKLNLIQQKCQLHGINLAIRDVLYSKKPVIGDQQVIDQEDRLVIEEENETIDMSHDPSNEQVQIKLECDDFDENFEVLDAQDDELDAPEANVSLILKIRELMKKHKYGKKLDVLHDACDKLNIEKLAVVLDCPTRWNSIYPMLQRFLMFVPAFRLVYAQQGSNFEFEQSELKQAQELINILDPIETFIKKVGESDANLMIADIAAIECLNKIGQTSELRTVFYRMINKRFEERRTVYSDILWDINNMNEIYGKNMFFSKPGNDVLIELQEKLKPRACDGKVVDAYEYAKNPKIPKVGQIDYELINSHLLNIKPASIRPEQAFSVAARIKCPVRGKLGPKHLDHLLFLTLNFIHFFQLK